MNLLHATDFHTRKNTGITFAINSLMGQTRDLLPQPATVGLIHIGSIDVPLPGNVFPYSVSPSNHPLARRWRYAPHYSETCDRVFRQTSASIIHVHGAWMHSQFAAVRTAHRLGIPRILTNHGLLAKWALAQPGRLGAVKKRLYLALMAQPLFSKISLYHAITPLDRDALHDLFPGKPIEIIPNAIDLAAFDSIPQVDQSLIPAPYVLFLGRLHPSKGVDLLIEAFGRARLPRDMRLVIVGPDEMPAYTKLLRRQIAQSPHPDQIELRDAVWDKAEKLSLYRNAWVTVVPSHSEVVSLVNLESAACGTPTITTHATGLFDWEDGGGLLIEPKTICLTQALTRSAAWSELERRDRSRASRRLVEKKYSTRVTGSQWIELYRSLSGT